MVVGEIPESVDLLVVGGGPGGYVAALRAAQLGRNVVLVDRYGERGVGGVCLNVGCIPSKALIEIATAAHHAGSLAHAGLRGSGTVHLGEWQKWRNGVVDELTGGIRALLKAAGVAVLAGELRFTRPTQAVVETPDGQARFLEFTDAVIATGSRPSGMPHLPRDGVHVLDSTDLLGLTEIPATLAVIGGGYVGLELGTAFAKLGATVTIVEAADRVLPTLDAGLSRPVVSRLRQLGATVLAGTLAEDYDGESLKVSHGGSSAQVRADAVLVAVGRTPNTTDLGLDRLGMSVGDRGLLDVAPDRRLSRHVAAIGDVTPGPALAHKASAEGLVAAEALSGRRVAFDPIAVPSVVFSDPEVASAGLSEAQARSDGLDVAVATFPLTASGRAATMSAGQQGFLRLVADNETGAVVGVHIVGPHASELIGEGVLAIEMGATLDDLAGTIHPHPTLSEQYAEAAHLALGRPIHISRSTRGTS